MNENDYNNKKRLLKLCDANHASFNIVEHNIYETGGIKIACGKYTYVHQSSYNLESAIEEMIRRLETIKITKDQYIEILSRSQLSDDSKFPSFELLRQNNIRYAPSNVSIEYLHDELNYQSVFETQRYLYTSFEKVDWSEFSHIREIIDNTPSEEPKIGHARDITPYRVIGVKKDHVKTNKG